MKPSIRFKGMRTTCVVVRRLSSAADESAVGDMGSRGWSVSTGRIFSFTRVGAASHLSTALERFERLRYPDYNHDIRKRKEFGSGVQGCGGLEVERWWAVGLER